MSANRVHFFGGEPVIHRAINQGDVVAMATMLSSLGLLPPANSNHHRSQLLSGEARTVRVGLDELLPDANGRPAKVEWLPLSAAAGHDIAAAATRDYELKPTKYARPGPLVIPAAVAANLVMSNLQIGGKNIFVGSGAVPCALFSEVSVNNSLSSYVATNAAPITFTLQNVHASATQTVRGVWVCDTQEIQI